MTTYQRKKIIKPAVFCLVCAVTLTIAAPFFIDSTPSAVAHAGGAYRGNFYTNTIEALDNSYSKGFRLLELDLLIDKDKNIVCGYHGEKKMGKTTGTTPCTGRLLEKWLLAKPDASIITDTKGPTRPLYEALSKMPESAKERIIIQTYQESDYISAKELGFNKIYLSFYRNPEKEEENLALLKAKPRHLKAVVIPHRKILTVGAKVRRLVKKNTVVYIHTINDKETRERIEKKYNHGIYTDSLTP